MILYHGTNASFEAIDLSRSRPNKDFGRGFYLSADKEQALSLVINSDTYQRILNDDTQLYYQSPRYVYSFLDNELKTGKM